MKKVDSSVLAMDCHATASQCLAMTGETPKVEIVSSKQLAGGRIER